MSVTKSFSFEPMLCESAERPPKGSRMALRAETRWISRDWPQVRAQPATLVTQSEGFHPPLSRLVKAIAELPSDTLIDGEIVALDAGGESPRSTSSRASASGASLVVLYAFDLLHGSGQGCKALASRRAART